MTEKESCQQIGTNTSKKKNEIKFDLERKKSDYLFVGPLTVRQSEKLGLIESPKYMSSLFAEGVDVLFSPEGNEFEKMWHGFQTPRKGGIALDGSNIREALCPIVSCGVKPELEMEISGELAMEMKNWKLIAADCRNGIAKKFVPIHIAKKGYQIFDNEKAFYLMVSAAVEVLGSDGFQIATVGTVGAYSQFMVSLAIKGVDTFKISEKDKWKQFFNLNTSHNGMIGSNRMLSALRMVCFNTILASIGDAEQAGTIASMWRKRWQRQPRKSVLP